MKEKSMKKLLFIPVVVMSLISCGKEPEPVLPPVDKESKYAYINGLTSCLTTENLAEDTQVSTSVYYKGEIEEGLTYTFEIGAGAYLKVLTSGYTEIQLKNGNYIKSVSEYTVDRLIVDYYATKGVHHKVYVPGGEIEGHESSVEPVDKDGGGEVLEYPINSTSWSLSHDATSEFKTASIYSITVVIKN